MAGSGDSIRAGVTCVWDAAQHRQVEDKTLSPRLPLHAITLPPLAALAKIVLCVLESSPRSAMHARFATLSKIVCVMRVHDAGAQYWPSALGLLASACQVIAYTNPPV
jgi:hypothetical protein